MKTKEEIRLQLKQDFAYTSKGTEFNEGYTLPEFIADKCADITEEYAKQKAISFISWYELSGWIFNPSTGTCKNMKFYDVEEKSFEDLYKEFELTQKV